jgi:hypothetical protein
MNWAPWLELTVRSTLLLLAAEAVFRMARRASARFRHRLLLCTFVLLVLLPVLQVALPQIPVSRWRPLAHPRVVCQSRQPSAATRIRLASVSLVGRPMRRMSAISGGQRFH